MAMEISEVFAQVCQYWGYWLLVNGAKTLPFQISHIMMKQFFSTKLDTVIQQKPISLGCGSVQPSVDIVE